MDTAKSGHSVCNLIAVCMVKWWAGEAPVEKKQLQLITYIPYVFQT